MIKINGINTNIHETVFHPFLHNQFKTTVQTKANINFRTRATNWNPLNRPTIMEITTKTKYNFAGLQS
jgi:hypothetical protein